MKVYIGPYKRYISPYHIVEKIFFWTKTKDEYGFKVYPDWVHNIGKWLAQDKNGKDSRLTKILSWIDSKRKRKVKVKIEPYDVWDMNSELALIILPMLKELRRQDFGSPFTDVEDVPSHLHPTEGPSDKNGYTDNTVHERWKWILDEMIWTFEQLVPDCDWESQYHKGECDYVFEKTEDGKFYEMKTGPKHNATFDVEGYKNHSDKISNGLRLFGKYYQGLWN